MSKLKIGILASIAGLLLIAAIMAVVLAIIYAVNDSPLYLFYGLIAVPTGIGAKMLFWVTEYRS